MMLIQEKHLIICNFIDEKTGRTIKERFFVSTFVKCRTTFVKIKVFYRNFPVIKRKSKTKQIMTINIISGLRDLLTKKSKQFI